MPTSALLDPVAATATTGDLTASRLRRSRLGRSAGLVLLGVLVVAVAAASLVFGARDIPLGTVLDALAHRTPGDTDVSVVRDLRIPRTLLGLAGGAALGLVGVLLQGFTRNPVADPSLIGINAGASLLLVVGITVLGVDDAAGYVWFAFLGAGVAAAVVYGAASLGWEGATPVKLALIGAALTASATSATTLVLLSDRRALQEFRFWQVGSLVGRDAETLVRLAPFLVVGAVLALVAGRTLNLLALGDDLARGLGQNVAAGRLTVVAAIILLSGAATALVGPIAFVGLVVPHVARAIVGTDHRWILPYSALLGALLLVGADVIGRLVVRPSELEAGIVVAFLGAPVMIWLIRRAKAVSV